MPELPWPLTVGKSSAEKVTLLGPPAAGPRAESSALLLSMLACKGPRGWGWG